MVSDLNEMADATRPDWPNRRWALAVLGAIVGIAVDLVLTPSGDGPWSDDVNRVAAATFFGISGIVFAFVVERGKIFGSAAFAIVAGLVVASVLYWSGDFNSWEPWRLVSALLTVAIAAPLFQAWRDSGGAGTHIAYAAAHDRAWTNVCLWFATWAFVGITFVLAWLLAMLFNLIGIDALEELLKQSRFSMALAGAAFGGATGLLRDRERIVGLLQRIAMMVLSVLAPVLGAGLLLFLAALPFTGLDALWETTKETTPILLSCVIGALVLANSVIGDGPEDESRQIALRWSAMALGAAILPLAVIAAISTGLRIDQYGLTPARLWAATFTAIACAFGLAYLVALVRGRGQDWAAFVRPANLRLALGLCALAFVLSTPIVSFGAIATRDQVARLMSGEIPPDKFDWAALRFEFGPAGVEALKDLKSRGKSVAIRTAATRALKADNPYDAIEQQRQQETLAQMVVMPRAAALPPALRERITQWDACGGETPCNILYRAEAGEAIIVNQQGIKRLLLRNGNWVMSNDRFVPADEKKRVDNDFAQGKVDIRAVTRRQLFVGEKPVGEPFE